MKIHRLLLLLFCIGLHGINAQKIPAEKMVESGESLRGLKGVSVQVIAKNFGPELVDQTVKALKAHGLQIIPDDTYPLLTYSITEATAVFGRVVGTGYYAQLTLRQAIPSGTKFIIATTYDDGQEIIGGPFVLIHGYQDSLETLLGDFLEKFDQANSKSTAKSPHGK